MKKIGILVLALVFVLFFLSRLVVDGMFIDGLLYAALSKNLAHGVGAFWALRLGTDYPPFFEHPPLVMGLQSLFFRLFGDGYATERVFCTIITVVTLVLMARIWKQVFSGQMAAAWWPLPLVLWMLNEDVYLSYSSNMLECTMTVFTLLAVHILLLFFGKNAPVATTLLQRQLGLILAAVCVFAAFLCKGPVGLYPLAFFGAAALANKRKIGLGIISSTILMVAWLAACIGLLLLYPPAKSGLAQYFDQQVMAALAGRRTENIAPHRLYMLQRLLETHFHLFALLGVAWWAARKYGRQAIHRTHWPTVMLFGGIAAAALLPVMISPKQAPHYIVPALPWVALAIGAAFAGLLEVLPTVRPPQWLSWGLGTGIVVALVWTGTRVGTERKDLAQVRPIFDQIPHGGTVCFHEKNGHTYVFESYFQRYREAHINRFSFDQKYVVVEDGVALPSEKMNLFVEIPIKDSKFKLYKHVE